MKDYKRIYVLILALFSFMFGFVFFIMAGLIDNLELISYQTIYFLVGIGFIINSFLFITVITKDKYIYSDKELETEKQKFKKSTKRLNDMINCIRRHEINKANHIEKETKVNSNNL